MTEIRNTSEEKLLEKYLYDELAPAEREALEERFFDDEEYFASLLEVENALVDLYARGKMSSGERQRFENKYLTTREKHEKVANAVALQKFLHDRKNESAAIENAPQISLWQRIQNAFASPRAWQYATAALIVLFALSIGFLVFERSRLRQELAGLRNAENQNADLRAARERELLSELENTRRRENELERQLNETASQSENLNRERQEELNRERAERNRLERELENLRRRREQTAPGKAPDATLNPVLATAVLRPNSAGNNSAQARTISVAKTAGTLNLTLTLPFRASTNESYSAAINDQQIAGNLKPRVSRNGDKRIHIRLPLQNLSETEHRITVKNNSETVFETYVFHLRKQ